MLESIAAGIISGIISSLFLYVALFRIKPKVTISDKICFDIKNKKFRIKIVNLSRANLVDVKYTLHACYRSGDGILDIEEVVPMKSRLEFVQAYSSADKNADYAVRLSYDISKFIEPRYTNFLFTFYAKHSLSGTALFVRKEYAKEDICCGRFETGRSTKILLETCHQQYLTCSEREKCFAGTSVTISC